MSSRSKMVQITRSMIMLDPQSMPVNLGYSAREDYPEQAFPAIAYDGRNVLPTALGYQSYFGEHNRLNIGDLADYHVQHVFHYQSVNMRTLSVALMEEGVAIANGSEGSEGFQWQLVLDLTADMEEGVRRLWTHCVIGNKLYFYLQGHSKFFALVNGAEYQETTVPTPITGVSINQEWFNTVSQTGILSYSPNFINMEGQLGIFKAGNRLGFWDSENAVAWSSATQVYDFKPSTTTFAGVTTFTDVVGRIVAIKQHGSGFIIYATRSVVLVSPISGSPEKWAGSAIFSDVGVVFDTQVVIGQPDTIHYAITSAGLARITAGRPEIIEVEAMDYVRNNNKIYAISLVDSRYLMIHVTNEFDSATPDVDVVKLPDSEGNQYNFPIPVPPTGDGSDDLLAMLNAMLQSQQGDFTEVQEPIPNVIQPAPDEALLPCWDVRSLSTNLTNGVIPASPQSDRSDPVDRIPCRSLILSTEFQRDNVLSPSWSVYNYYGKREIDSYYYDLERDAIDMGAIEFVDKYMEEAGRILELQQFSNQAHEILGNTNEGPGGNQLYWARYKSIAAPTSMDMGVRTYNTNAVIFSETINDQPTDFSTRVTDCGIEFFTHLATKRAALRLTEHSEDIVPVFTRIAIGLFFVDGELDTDWYGYTTHNDRYYYGVSSTDADLWAKAAWSNRTPPGLDWDSRTGLQIRIQDGGNLIDPDFIATYGVDSDAPATNRPSLFRFSQPNPTSSDDTAAWVAVPSDQVGLFPSDAFAALLGRQPTATVNTVTQTFPDPGDLSPECGPQTVVNGPNGFNVIQSPPIGAVKASTVRKSRTFGGYYDGFICAPVDLEIVNDFVATTGFGVVINTLTIYNQSPEAVYQQFIQDPRLNLEDIGEANLLKIRNKIEELIVNQPRVVQLKAITTTLTKDVINVEEEETPLFRAEVSGYGYYPKGGFSFRKTHSRSIFKPCTYAGSPEVYSGIPPLDPEGINPTLPGTGTLSPLRPPYSWDYPSLPELPPNYVIFQEGTFAPYYPTYEEAIVLDTQYTKWGRYNNRHKLVYSLFPVNRVDQTIVPSQAGVMRGGALRVNGECSVFSAANNDSRITYGKIGDYRLGWTKATKVVAQFGYPASAYVIVETSLNGDEIEPSLSQATTVPELRRVEMPFTLEGKFFNIRFEGQFNIVGLSLESQARSRR